MAHGRQLAILLTLVAGCAGVSESPRGELAPADTPMADASPGTTRAPVEIEIAPVAPPPSSKVEIPVAAPPPAVLAPAKPAPVAVPVPVTIASAPKHQDPVAVNVPVAAALDVEALKARLRDTTAIGILAKISLRQQMDELLNSFRVYYAGGQKTSLAALRKPYDAMVMKILDMLHEGDPSLARSVSSSREAIWGILADRERFSLMH